MHAFSTFSSTARRRGATSLAILGIAATTLVGCSAAEDTEDSAANNTAAASDSATASGDQVVELSDGWAKAADSNMTGVFGNMENSGDQAVTLESIKAEGVAGVAELHETVMNDETGSTEMRRVEGGFTIEAGETKTFEPGGDHLMLMDLQCSLKAGTNVSVDMTFENGQTQQITVPVRDYAGAKEEYAPGEEHSMKATPESTELPECHDS